MKLFSSLERMNIYFAGSIRGGRNDVGVYTPLITHLKKYGTVFTEHVGDCNLDEHCLTMRLFFFVMPLGLLHLMFLLMK